MFFGNASIPSTCTVQSSGDTRPYQTSQNSRTIIPQRPKPTPTSRTRFGAIFIRTSIQNGIFCQLLVPMLATSGEGGFELPQEGLLAHGKAPKARLEIVYPHGVQPTAAALLIQRGLEPPDGGLECATKRLRSGQLLLFGAELLLQFY